MCSLLFCISYLKGVKEQIIIHSYFPGSRMWMERRNQEENYRMDAEHRDHDQGRFKKFPESNNKYNSFRKYSFSELQFIYVITLFLFTQGRI